MQLSKLIGFVTLILVLPRDGYGQTPGLQKIADEMAKLGVKMTNLAKEYQEPDVISGINFSARLNDGEILFLLSDYQRAALVLYDLVRNPDNDKRKDYTKANYYLAESLYQIGHQEAAERYFQEIVEKGEKKYLNQAVLRLFQIADEKQDWTKVEDYLEKLHAQGPIPKYTAYTIAKSFVLQNKPRLAFSVIKDIPGQHPLAQKARYIVAICLLQMGELEKAQLGFKKLVQMIKPDAKNQSLFDLAVMNQGRILLEQEKYSEALHAYQYIDHNSPQFDESLYELIWAYIRAAERSDYEKTKLMYYKKAQYALHILELAGEDHPLVPEARLLMGNIQLRLGQFEKAIRSFEKIVKYYTPMRDQLQALNETGLAPMDYFHEISSESSEKRGLLPALAISWSTGEASLKKALAIKSGLDESEKTLNEAEVIVSHLLVILESENTLSFFPSLKDARVRIISLRNQLNGLGSRLLEYERNLVENHLDKKSRFELIQIISERVTLESEYSELKKRLEDVVEKTDPSQTRIGKIQKEAFRLKYAISSVDAQLNAMQMMLSSQGSKIPPETRQTVIASIALERRVLQELQNQQKVLAEQIQADKSVIDLGGNSKQYEEKIRKRYASNLEKERRILNRVAKSGAISVTLKRHIDSMRVSLANYYTELASFERNLDSIVAERSKQLLPEIIQVRESIKMQKQAVELERRNAEHMFSEIAQNSLHEVYQNFYDIVLRADVGMVDVTWSKKEQTSESITNLVSKQRSELQVLDTEFAEFLE